MDDGGANDGATAGCFLPSSSWSEKDGTGWAGFVAKAFGVVCRSVFSSSSIGGWIVGVGGNGIDSPPLANLISGAFFSSLGAVPLWLGRFEDVVASGRPETVPCRRTAVHFVNHAGTQPGGRTMTQTTEATISEIPMTAMYVPFCVVRGGEMARGGDDAAFDDDVLADERGAVQGGASFGVLSGRQA